MNFINRGRGTGKTMMLISASQVTGYPIIVSTEAQKKYLLDMASKMNCIIRCFTIHDFLVHDYNRMYKKILLDDCKDFIDDALNHYFKCEVVAGTMSIPMIGE